LPIFAGAHAHVPALSLSRRSFDARTRATPRHARVARPPGAGDVQLRPPKPPRALVHRRDEPPDRTSPVPARPPHTAPAARRRRAPDRDRLRHALHLTSKHVEGDPVTRAVAEADGNGCEPAGSLGARVGKSPKARPHTAQHGLARRPRRRRWSPPVPSRPVGSRTRPWRLPQATCSLRRRSTSDERTDPSIHRPAR